MAVNHFPGGEWPTMLTPFRDGAVDYPALEALVEWYIAHGVSGLFAVCQSSEMFFLSLEERVGIARFVNEKAAGRVPVIASGHISDSFEDQVHELTAMTGTGVDAVILITNRLAKEEESDEVWLANLQALLDKLPSQVPLGFYECPYPYKRVLSPKVTRWCAESGRFFFLKDTCCDIQQIKEKLDICRDSNLKLYNANTSTAGVPAVRRHRIQRRHGQYAVRPLRLALRPSPGREGGGALSGADHLLPYRAAALPRQRQVLPVPGGAVHHHRMSFQTR